MSSLCMKCLYSSFCYSSAMAAQIITALCLIGLVALVLKWNDRREGSQSLNLRSAEPPPLINPAPPKVTVTRIVSRSDPAFVPRTHAVPFESRVVWDRVVAPPEHYQIQYADRHGECGLRTLDTAH